MRGLFSSTYHTGRDEGTGVCLHEGTSKVSFEEGQGAGHPRMAGKLGTVYPLEDLRTD